MVRLCWACPKYTMPGRLRQRAPAPQRTGRRRMTTGIDPRGADASQPALHTGARSTRPAWRPEGSIRAFPEAAIGGPGFGRRNLLGAGATFPPAPPPALAL